jgi:alginate O-acetyltransferase complex protein AlgI
VLFNSYAFLVGFLPVVLGGTALLTRLGRPRAAVVWLLLASLFFYGFWRPPYLLLLGASIVANFALGLGVASPRPGRRLLLVTGVVVNLGALAYFKYADFLAENLQRAGVAVPAPGVTLPLAISFFTFTQVAYLVDIYRDPKLVEKSFANYALFVSLFPHLIAGPIVRHGELLPEIRAAVGRVGAARLGGLSLFILGLAKKVLLADTISPHVADVFSLAETGTVPPLVQAWSGALAYTLQLYFDFSGYSDMAIGLGLLLGVRFPKNFDSPYKATSIIDFWRRWHITLSRFLRDYLYIPLGGNRLGPARRYLNLFVTMLLGGLWHGAGWTFVVWGALHGAYLGINHLLASVWERRGVRVPVWCGRGVTFLAVLVGWVVFRAQSFAGAQRMLLGLVGGGGLELPPSYRGLFEKLGLSRLLGSSLRFEDAATFPGIPLLAFLALLLVVVFVAPNSDELVTRGESLAATPGRLRLELLGGLAMGLVLATCLAALGGHSEFLYFRF